MSTVHECTAFRQKIMKWVVSAVQKIWDSFCSEHKLIPVFSFIHWKKKYILNFYLFLLLPFGPRGLRSVPLNPCCRQADSPWSNIYQTSFSKFLLSSGTSVKLSSRHQMVNQSINLHAWTQTVFARLNNARNIQNVMELIESKKGLAICYCILEGFIQD